MASTLRDEISRLELLHAAHPDGLVFPHLADAYRRDGRFAQAESLLEAGLRRHGQYSSAHVALGRLRLDQGKRQEAQDAFRRVLDLDPHNQIALQNLAEIAASQGRLQDALGLFRRLVKVKGDDGLSARVNELERQVEAGAEDRKGNGQYAVGTSTPPRSGRVASRDASTSPTGRDGNGGGRPAGPSVPDRGPDSPRDQAPARAEPGEVVTETMAELYAKQGLHHRAVAVYRQLLDRSPEDPRLRAKLDRSLAMLSPPAQAPGATTPTRSAPSDVPAPPAPRATRDTREAPTPSIRRSPAPAVPIRHQLRSLLAWKPEAAAEAPPATRPAEAAAPPPPRAVPEIRPEIPPVPEAAPVAPQPVPEAPPTHGQEGAWIGAARPAATTTVESGTDPLEAASLQTKSLIALTDLLVGLLEFRDPFFRGSSSLTRLLAISVGEEMDLPVADRVDLALAAVLRDLGRLALGGRLVQNQRSMAGPEARRRIERHVDLALHLMEGIELPKAVRRAVRHHHERWDGAGYPDALSGERIPVLARILAVVDAFAAMVSPRPYRLPRKVPEAAAELQQESGTQFDPEVVNALVRVLARRDQPHLGFVQRHHLLLVNPDHPGAVVTAAKLCSAGYLAEVAVDPATARERLRRVPVAALVVSAECGAEATGALLRELRMDPMFASLPIVVSDAAGVGLRVRLLEAGADVCFPPGVRHAELQGTLGALVRRTLKGRGEDGTAGSAESPWLALQGDLQDFPLTWLLQVMKYDSRTAAVGIRGMRGEGVIYLSTGDAVHAQIRGGGSGEGALREMLQWKEGRFTVRPDATPRERTITTSIMHFLLSQAVDEDHASAGIFGAVSGA